MEPKIEDLDGPLTAEEVARYLKVPVDTINQAVYLAKIPHLRIPYLVNGDGRRRRYRHRFMMSDVLKTLAQEVKE